MKPKGLFSIIVASVFGLLVLTGYFIKLSLLVKISDLFLNWAILLAAFAVLLGIFNLLIVHMRKMASRQKGSGYSLLLVLAMLTTFVIGVIIPFYPKAAPALDFVFRAFQLPIEASLMAILTVTLVYSSIRLLGRRLNVFSIVFLLTVLLILLGTVSFPFLGTLPWLSDLIRPFVAQVLAGGGARGLLIGVALGSLVMGLRVLFGADHPYGGK